MRPQLKPNQIVHTAPQTSTVNDRWSLKILTDGHTEPISERGFLCSDQFHSGTHIMTWFHVDNSNIFGCQRKTKHGCFHFGECSVQVRICSKEFTEEGSLL